MVTPIRRAGRPTTRQAFSLQQLTVSFGMVVIVVIGVGLTLKKAVQGRAPTRAPPPWWVWWC